MLIHPNFTGGNVRIDKIEDSVIYVNSDLRDTTQDWFYWAFCVEGAGGQTLSFRFPKNRVGYYGPAVSHDLKTWTWLNRTDDAESFTYTFAPEENKVYFAHNMLYHPDRFEAFVQGHGLSTEEFCLSHRKKRPIPCLKFGDGKRTVILTARHHACEATGSYVLEGVLDELIRTPLPDTRVLCVPFVDYDGVVDGDQGKARAPYDHNRDYNADQPSLYTEIAEIRRIADEGVLYAFDFHSPWHKGRNNDSVFVVRKRENKMAAYERFAELFESEITEDAMGFRAGNCIQPGESWNKPDAPCFGAYMNDGPAAALAFTLETAYFGKDDHIFTQDGAVETGRCFARALRRYDAEIR